ncbi:MAG: bifunctional metallophosphatase/5'-nucleotidase [Oscillospiraceae bacterium]|nr:bifunctional metallophosphatase/5'-nucleotidase [Oscillospiraceae bacterium]
MKKLCLLLALVLLLTGCGKETASTPETNPNGSVNNSGHVDKNDDGLCDDCQEVVLVSVDIFTINDLHGKLADADNHPGVDELSTYLKQQANSSNMILMSSGDMWQGAPESNLTKGFIITDWMNQMGFASMTLGNHEYDWGEDWVRQNSELAEFPFLAINIFDSETNERVDYCESSVVVDVEGVQIGIIGAMGDCYSSIATEHTTGFYFKTGRELTELVKEESQKLRSEGVDFIIYSIHDGYGETSSGVNAQQVGNRELGGYYDSTLSEGYVDLMFEAHTHQKYVLVDQYGVYHLQGGGDNKGISHATVLINKANGNSSVLTTELLSTGEYALMEDDPVVADLMEKYNEQVAPATRIVGNNAKYRNKYDICQMVADLYCDKGLEKWGAEYDIVLGGGFISCRDPGYMSAGEVKYGLLQSVLPFDNQITLCSIQGRDLIEKFLETEHYAYYIKLSPYGEKIKDSIDPDGTYYVVTDSYSAYYKYNKMTVIDIYAEKVFARDLVADFISEGSLA